MRRQEISIADIARAAGVSHSTVSRALRDSSLISVDVRGRIQRLAREMGYTPNAIAQSLQTRQTSTIGLVVTSIADPFWGDVMKGVEEVARASGFSVFLSASHNDPDQEMAIIETFHRRRVDGILVAASRITSNYKERLDHIQVPTVLINSQAESEARLLHWVSVDDRMGAQLAVEHLLQIGHRSIGYLGISSRPKSNHERLLGYQSALAAAGVPYRDEWVAITPGEEASHEEDVAAGQASLPRLLDAGVTAVFCYNDMTALGVLMACRERGIAVPGELSVIGFDDIRMASYATPPLTTIHQPKVELGRLATQVVLGLLNNLPGRNHQLLPTLILRASTAQLAEGAGSHEASIRAPLRSPTQSLSPRQGDRGATGGREGIDTRSASYPSRSTHREAQSLSPRQGDWGRSDWGADSEGPYTHLPTARKGGRNVYLPPEQGTLSGGQVSLRPSVPAS